MTEQRQPAKVEWINMRTGEVRVKLLDGTVRVYLWDTRHVLPFVGDTVSVLGFGARPRSPGDASYDSLVAVMDFGPAERAMVESGATLGHASIETRSARHFPYGRLARHTVSSWYTRDGQKVTITREER